MGDGRYRTEKDLLDRIALMEKRLSRVERTPQLPTAGVNVGAIFVEGGQILIRKVPFDPDPDAVDRGLIGLGTSYTADGQDGMGMLFRRSEEVSGSNSEFSGRDSLVFRTVEGDDPVFKFATWELNDKDGGTLISDTYNARKGFGDPKWPITWWNPSSFTSSTSGTFADIAQTFWYYYHPHLRIRVVSNNDASTTSEIRVIDMDSGSVVAGPVTGAAGSITFNDLIVKRSATFNGVDGSNGNIAWLAVQHRRASGAGTVRHFVAEMIAMDLSLFEAW